MATIPSAAIPAAPVPVCKLPGAFDVTEPRRGIDGVAAAKPTRADTTTDLEKSMFSDVCRSEVLK